jgi:hypothetical protein
MYNKHNFMKNNKYTKEQIEEVIKSSITTKECLQKLNRPWTGDNYNWLMNLIRRYDINKDHFLSHSQLKKNLWKEKPFVKKYSIEDIFCENKFISGGILKKILYKNNIKQPICELCGQDENWNGKQMSLILDHINGINTDNRIENLRIVCPNCDATLETFRGKNRKKNKKKQEKVKNNMRLIKIEHDKNVLLSNNVDFSKYGWRLKIAEVLNCTPQYAGKFVKKHLPEIWKTCWKHK